jgi:hypothetical protein
MIDAGTGNIATVAGTGSPGFSGDGGLAVDAALNHPYMAWADAGGDVYIADYNNHRIRKVDGKTGIITTVAGTGTNAYSGDSGAATRAEMNGPRNVVGPIAAPNAQWGWAIVPDLY